MSARIGPARLVGRGRRAWRHPGVVSAVALFWCAASSAAAQERLPADSVLERLRAAVATPDVRAAAFQKVLRTVRARYHDRGLNGVDWDAAGLRVLADVDTTTTVGALYDVLGVMTSALGDAHTRVHDPVRAVLRVQQAGVSTGVLVWPVDTSAVVVTTDSALTIAGGPLRPGDRIVAVDGRAVAQVVRGLVPSSTTGSAHSTTFRAWTRVLEGPPGSSARVLVEDTTGQQREVVLRRTVRSAVPVVRSQLLPSGVLVLRFDGFRAGMASALDSALRAYPEAAGVVLDLRWNGGGSASEAGRVIGLFVGERVVTARTSVRSRWLWMERERQGQWTAGGTGTQRYAGPVAVLVSPRSASGAELVASSLQEEGRAVVVGERSCGCLLGITRYEPLPGGGELAVSEVGLVAGRSGRRVEGDGVHPDVVVVPTRSAIARGVDAVLDAAVAALRPPPP
jgi:carboxyl-terminal processing protease